MQDCLNRILESQSSIYTNMNQYYMQTVNNSHQEIPMPTVRFWQNLMTGGGLYSESDKYYKDAIEEVRNPQPMPDISVFSAKRDSKMVNHETVYHARATNDNYVFYTGIGIRLLGKLGATKSELESNFEDIGQIIAHQLQLTDDVQNSPFLSSLIPDPEMLSQPIIVKNQEYPAIRYDRPIPHKQVAEIIEVDAKTDDIPIEDIKNFYQFNEGLSDFSETPVGNISTIENINKMQSELRRISPTIIGAYKKKANPYGKIGAGCFQNKAALKLANLDAIYGLTKEAVDSEYFYYANVGAKPGGFSDYLNWKLQGITYGFCLTSKTENLCGKQSIFYKTDQDSKIESVIEKMNGDLINNVEDFIASIRARTHSRGVRLFLADWGNKNENCMNTREQDNKRVVANEIYCATQSLGEGGSLILKIYGCYTEFMVELLYLTAKVFEKFSIIKPYSTNPTSPERYAIFTGFKQAESDNISNVFSDIVLSFPDEGEFIALYPIEEIPDDFLTYIRSSNDEISETQCNALHELLTYIHNPELDPLNQADVEERCLAEWGLPPSIDRRLLATFPFRPRVTAVARGTAPQVDQLFPLRIDEAPNKAQLDRREEINRLWVSQFGSVLARHQQHAEVATEYVTAAVFSGEEINGTTVFNF